VTALLLAILVQDPVFRTEGSFEFTHAGQVQEVDLSGKLDGVEAVTIGAWVFPKRAGEQVFFSRGLPECGPNGERMFRPNDGWVNFLLGTDAHGFLMGTVHGNGSMPFPFVTLNDVPIDSWSQLVIVKDAKGFQKFYRNGTLVCDSSGTSDEIVGRPMIGMWQTARGLSTGDRV